MTAKEKAEIVKEAFDDKKAQNIKVIEVGEMTSLAEYFVICSCNSSVQVRACADNAEEKLSEAGISLGHREGYRGGAWILLDYDDVICHVMTTETREFYDIERLWED